MRAHGAHVRLCARAIARERRSNGDFCRILVACRASTCVRIFGLVCESVRAQQVQRGIGCGDQRVHSLAGRTTRPRARKHAHVYRPPINQPHCRSHHSPRNCNHPSRPSARAQSWPSRQCPRIHQREHAPAHPTQRTNHQQHSGDCRNNPQRARTGSAARAQNHIHHHRCRTGHLLAGTPPACLGATGVGPCPSLPRCGTLDWHCPAFVAFRGTTSPFLGTGDRDPHPHCWFPGPPHSRSGAEVAGVDGRREKALGIGHWALVQRHRAGVRCHWPCAIPPMPNPQSPVPFLPGLPYARLHPPT